MGSTDCIQPNDVLKVKLYKGIAANNTIPVGFRRLGIGSAPEKPRWVLVGLQTDRHGNQERNAAIFDH